MARLLRIERAITWMARTLTANRDQNPTPEGIINQILPNIDVFGSQRMGEAQLVTVAGALGGIEVAHTQVPQDRIRFYLSMEYSSDDAGIGSPRRIRAGRVIPTDAGFPFASFADEVLATAGEFFAVRNFTVGPGAFAVVQSSNGMGAAARMTITLVWIETPLGEYLQSVE